MNDNRWTDEFLDRMRIMGDAEADACYASIKEDEEIDEIDLIFRKMNSNDAVPGARLFPTLSDFFARTHTLPPGTDFDRINRGEEIFRKHSFEHALVLLMKGLPEGYAAPNLSIILNISGDLRVHPYKRLLSTLQAVINVSSAGGFQNGGRAVITAQKLRLLHSGVRALTRRYRPEFEAKYGVPSNLEDMLGTIMGFSHLVILGMRALHIKLTPQEEEDLLYVWRIFAIMMGIHPPGEPYNFIFIPDDVFDAGRFYEAYARRHYVPAEQNPDGVKLADANLRMMEHFVPKPLRWLGAGALPRLYMTELMDIEMCARIGLTPILGRKTIKKILSSVHRVTHHRKKHEKHDDRRFAMILFQDLIDISRSGEVTFTVPQSLQDMIAMAK